MGKGEGISDEERRLGHRPTSPLGRQGCLMPSRERRHASRRRVTDLTRRLTSLPSHGQRNYLPHLFFFFFFPAPLSLLRPFSLQSVVSGDRARHAHCFRWTVISVPLILAASDITDQGEEDGVSIVFHGSGVVAHAMPDHFLMSPYVRPSRSDL